LKRIMNYYNYFETTQLNLKLPSNPREWTTRNIFSVASLVMQATGCPGSHAQASIKRANWQCSFFVDRHRHHVCANGNESTNNLFDAGLPLLLWHITTKEKPSAQFAMPPRKKVRTISTRRRAVEFDTITTSSKRTKAPGKFNQWGEYTCRRPN
jgi:hypothetical protein